MLFEKTAIVTGAASGIGYAVAQALRQEGAHASHPILCMARLRRRAPRPSV